MKENKIGMAEKRNFVEGCQCQYQQQECSSSFKLEFEIGKSMQLWEVPEQEINTDQYNYWMDFHQCSNRYLYFVIRSEIISHYSKNLMRKK